MGVIRKEILIILLIVLFASMASVVAGDTNDTASDVLSVDTINDDTSISSVEVDDVVKSNDNQTVTDGDKVSVADGSPTTDSSDDGGDTVVGIDERLTVDKNSTKNLVVTDSNDKKASGSLKLSSDDESGDVLGATGDNDVLGADVSGGEFSNLKSAVQGTGNVNIKGNIEVPYTGWTRIARNTDIAISRDNFVIDGEGHTINCAADLYRSDARCFNINQNRHDITFRNIVFINGATTGGAVYINQNCYNIRFEGCTFRANSATSGSAIYIDSGCRNIIFDGCTFTNNQATSSGGAIYATGSEINIDGCTFTGNSIQNNANDARAGGAIYINAATQVTITDSTFENNMISNTNTGGNSRASGGAIALAGNSQKVNIVGNTFTNNKVTGGAANQENRVGGAIYVVGGMDYLLIDDCTFTQNTANRDGGAVMFSGDVSNIHFVDSTFSDNSATYGGALMFNNNVVDSDVIGCTFTHNTATGDEGGAIDYYNNVHNLTIASTFINNIASKSGAAIAMDKAGATFSDIKIINSTFKDHTCTNGAVFIRENPGTLIIANTIFENNNATSQVAAGTVYFPEVDNLNVSNSKFINNNAPNGAALYVISNNNNGIFNFENSDFTNNHATSGSAGALYLSVNGVNIDNCTFDDNSANANGGAIFLQNTIVNYFNIVDSTFERNTVVGSGAAIYYNHGSEGQTVTPVSTISNLTNCSFISNSATADIGGAFLTSANKMVVSYCNFTDNSGNANGGGLLFGSPNGIVTLCNFNGNSANYGAGLYTDDYLSYATGMSITYCNFTDNNANNNGGGLYVQNTRSVSGRITDFNNNHFTSNTASYNGGAIYWDPYDDFDTTNSIFDDNTAGQHGGAIYFSKVLSNIIFNHSNFTDNTATNSEGGAIYFYAGGNTFKINSCN